MTSSDGFADNAGGAFTDGRSRIGLFGLFGGGNTGNDGSLEAMLRYLEVKHPEAVLDVKCPGPKRIESIYGVAGTPMRWYTQYAHRTSGASAVALKAIGKGIDAFRTLSWVRQHDAVIVPGTGILENTLPLRPTGTPYELFLLCASGKLLRKRVALVSVGANRAKQPLTRWLFKSAAQLATYRSYRDAPSREAMRQAGVDTSRDNVYPDLAFSLPSPPGTAVDGRTVGVCVMAYTGSSDDRSRANQIYDSYVENMTLFVRWLVDTGHKVRMFWGDDVDEDVAEAILADLRQSRSQCDLSSVSATACASLGQLIEQMALVDTVVGTRYHNVLCGIKLCKPTISIGYSTKHEALMADAGLSEFSQPARSIDVDRLTDQFTELEKRSEEIRRRLAERNAAKAPELDRQFAILSSLLFPSCVEDDQLAPPNEQLRPADHQFA
jgi:polysaccharide pyruvyl transferase WcaK-like protein